MTTMYMLFLNECVHSGSVTILTNIEILSLCSHTNSHDDISNWLSYVASYVYNF